jgi:DnaJ family protein B protein 12
LKVDYYINPAEVEGYSTSHFAKLDQRAEINFVDRLGAECHQEEVAKQQLYNEAQGWFFQDPEKMQRARNMEMKSCRKLDSMGLARRP